MKVRSWLLIARHSQLDPPGLSAWRDRGPAGKYVVRLRVSCPEWYSELMEDSLVDVREAALCATDPHRTSTMRPGPSHILPEWESL